VMELLVFNVSKLAIALISIVVRWENVLEMNVETI
jgi:hypothetical protein